MTMWVRRVAVTGVAVVALFASCITAPASADTVSAPTVYVRLVDPLVQTSPWQALPATLNSLGPYELGVAVQPTSDVHNRQAIEVDYVSHPGGSPPSAWQGSPYVPFCELVTGDVGSVAATGTRVNFQGDGTYTLNVSAYTTAQWNARPGNTCSGGPTTPVSLTVNASVTAQIVGTPLSPRTTAKAHGFNGLQFTEPTGNEGSRFRCARNPVLQPDGSVTGSPRVDSGNAQTTDTQASTIQVGEKDAFTVPGRWACSVQVFGGDNVMNWFGLPWVTTPTVTVKGQYVRDPTRTSLQNLHHGRVRVVVTGIRQITQAIAGGRLTFTLFRAGCRRGRIISHTVLRLTSRVDGRGRAAFVFRSPTQFAFYAGRPTFGGGPFMLAGDDPSDLPMQSLPNVKGRPIFVFVNPSSWAPCG